jgi:multicomponent Na+:H+ antiporter subunit G
VSAVAVLLDILSWALLMAGAAFSLVGGIGLLRLPDLFTRMHGAGLIDTLGAGLILIGLMLQGGASLVTVKLILILLFIFFTSPTATHALAKAALHGGLKPLLEQREDKPSKS